MEHNVPEFPNRLEIELVSDCNLRCTYCPRHYVNHLKGYIDEALFYKIIDEAERYPETIIVLHRRGESLLHPRLKDLFGYAHGKFREVQMATNATLLTPDKFDAIVSTLTFISFSLEAPETYNAVRVPAKYEYVENKILAFLEYNKGRVKTQASMVRTDKTRDEEVASFKNTWTGKVDRVRIYEEHSREGAFGSVKTPRSERKTCVMPFYEMLIYDDGLVGRCNHDWNGESMGNLNTATIKDVWHSAQFAKLRREQLSLQFSDQVCKRCDSWYSEIGNQGTGEVIEK